MRAVSLSPTRTRVEAHHPLGMSTGALVEDRGDWISLAAKCLDTSVFAAELSALHESELDGLLAFLNGDPPLPFQYLSLHAPTKGRVLSERALVERLMAACARVEAIVVHPDTIDDPAAYRPLGRTLAIENMDARKPVGRTVGELQALFDALPRAGFCFDIAHAAAIDPSMRLAHDLLDAFGLRLREVHLSALADDGATHVPPTAADLERFTPVLRRCADVPWILEAPLH